MDHRLNSSRDIEVLLSKGEEFWLDLLNKYFVQNHSIVVKGLPSIQEQNIMAEQEKLRIEEQVLFIAFKDNILKLVIYFFFFIRGQSLEKMV